MRTLLLICVLLAGIASTQDSTKSTFICKVGTVTDADQTSILQTINTWRSQVAGGQLSPLPSAADMKEIRWDPLLAASATEWSKQCIPGNSPYARYRPNKTQPIKELVFVASNCRLYDSPQWPKAFALWTKSGNKLPFDLIDKYSYANDRGPDIRAASLLAWSTTAFVGCAYADYEPLGAGNNYKQYIVCHFQTGGNVMNSTIYQRGTICSKCQDGYGCGIQYPQLCSRNFTVNITKPNNTNVTAPTDRTNTCNGTKFTAADKAALVLKLNTERNNIAKGFYLNLTSATLTTGFPTSSNMRQLVWDDGLEQAAMSVAGTCDTTVLNTPQVKVSQVFIGQGAITPFTTPNWGVATDLWIRAKQNVSTTLLTKFGNSTASDRAAVAYAQVAWGLSSTIGCAYSNYAEVWTGSNGIQTPSYRQYIVCQLAEAGGIVGQPVYTQGKPCSACGTGYACSADFTSLCLKSK